MITPDGNTVCDTCGKVLVMGDYPFCPHGSTRSFINRDEIPGGVLCENYGPNPVRFYSHSERRAYMQRAGLQESERFSPTPGTDIDPAGIPNPAGYVDPQTLKNAAELICRNGKAEWDGVKAGVLRNLTAETVADAERMRDALTSHAD